MLLFTKLLKFKLSFFGSKVFGILILSFMLLSLLELILKKLPKTMLLFKLSFWLTVLLALLLPVFSIWFGFSKFEFGISFINLLISLILLFPSIFKLFIILEIASNCLLLFSLNKSGWSSSSLAFVSLISPKSGLGI